MRRPAQMCVLASACAIALFTFLPVCAMPLSDIEAAVGVWRPTPDGYISYLSEDRLYLVDQLNYDTETGLFGRFKIDMPLLLPDIYLMASPLQFDEAVTLDDFFEFGGIVILPGIEFDSELSINQYDIGFYYDIPLMKRATFELINIEAGVNLRIYDVEAQVVQRIADGTGLEESEDETALVPMAYAGLFIQPTEAFALEGELRGFAWDGSELFSAIGRLKINTVGPHFIAGGYRLDTGVSDEWDLVFDIDFSGPFLETGFQF